MGYSQKCPFCDKSFSDLLKHFRFTHKIRNTEQYSQNIIKIENEKTRQKAFATYVEDLKSKKKNGDITSEKYRELITEWNNQNKVS